MRIDNMNRPVASIEQAAQTVRAASGNDAQRAQPPALSFEAMLKRAEGQSAQPVFSKHAQSRMALRDIALSSQELTKLSDAISKAKDKGSRSTLILMGERAFIVSVPDNTVVTAMKGRDLKENVFTQIDGAVIV